MALTNYIVGPVECTGTAPDGSGGYIHPFSGRVVLNETVDVTNNQSTVSWAFQIYINRNNYVSNYRYTNNNRVTVKIAGKTVFSSSNVGTVALNGVYAVNPLTLASGSTVIKHNDDGTKTGVAVEANYTQSNSAYMQTIAPTGSVNLETIPRKAIISSTPAITLEPTGTTDSTVTWASTVDTFWYKVQYLYGNTILDTSSATQDTSYTWAVPASISEYVTDAKQMTLTAVLHTYSDSACTNEIGSSSASVTVNFSDNFAPALAYTLAVNNDLIPAANRQLFSGVAIQYTSRLALTFTGTGVRDATIAGYTCVVDGKGYSGSSVLTDPIENSGTITISAIVTDSRGFTGTVTITQEVTAYAYPQLKPYGNYSEVLIYRCDQYGNEDETGANIRVLAASKSAEILNAGVNVNRAVVKLRHSTGSTWSQYAEFSDNTGDVSVNTMIGGYFPDTVAYIFEIHAEDLLGNSSGVVMITVPIADIPLHLREGGHGVGIGDYASSTPNRLMVGYEAHFSKPIYTDAGMAISAVDSGSSTMADLWDAVKDSPGGTGAVTLTAAYGNMGADDYTYIAIPYDDENGLFYFSLLGSDTGDLWIVHIINDTICQPFKLTGTR